MKFIEGKLYMVRFLDHTCGVDHLVEIDVVGWVIKQDEDCLVLSHWKIDSDDKEIVRNNYEYTSLAKKIILSKRAIR